MAPDSYEILAMLRSASMVMLLASMGKLASSLQCPVLADRPASTTLAGPRTHA